MTKEETRAAWREYMKHAIIAVANPKMFDSEVDARLVARRAGWVADAAVAEEQRRRGKAE